MHYWEVRGKRLHLALAPTFQSLSLGRNTYTSTQRQGAGLYFALPYPLAVLGCGYRPYHDNAAISAAPTAPSQMHLGLVMSLQDFGRVICSLMPRWLVSYAQVLANSLVQLIIVAVVFVHSTVATGRKMAAPHLKQRCGFTRIHKDIKKKCYFFSKGKPCRREGRPVS